jgi:ribonuclease P protein component
MISRTHRFHGRAGLKRLYGNSKTARSGILSLRYAPNGRHTGYRLAIVVSRKVSKSAVVRNRIRRRLYESVRILSGSFTAPHDLILMVYDEKVATMPAAVLATEVTKLCQKAGLSAVLAPKHAIVETKE